MLRKIDCVLIRVGDVDAAASYYAATFGLDVLWREHDEDSASTMLGLGLPETDAEIVLHDAGIPDEIRVHYLVDDVTSACEYLLQRGCTIQVAPFDITIGKCATVQDPFGVSLSMLDMTKEARS